MDFNFCVFFEFIPLGHHRLPKVRTYICTNILARGMHRRIEFYFVFTPIRSFLFKLECTHFSGIKYSLFPSNSCCLILFRRLQSTLQSAYIIFFTAEESSYPILLHLTNYSNLLLSLEMLTVLLISPSPYTQCRIRTNALTLYVHLTAQKI